MKYALTDKVGKEYLTKADQIIITDGKTANLGSLIKTYPDKTYIVEMKANSEPSVWEYLRICSEKVEGRLYAKLYDLSDIVYCKEKNLKYFYAYPASSFYELRGLKDLGVSYVYLTASIFFDMDAVKDIGVPVRLIPNLCYDAYIPRADGVCGQWVRPEDQDVYEEAGCETIEFINDLGAAEKEEALYRIYAQRKEWPGEMNMLFINFNYPAENRMVPPNLALVRLNCKQLCQKTCRCQLCKRTLDLQKVAKKVKVARQTNL